MYAIERTENKDTEGCLSLTGKFRKPSDIQERECVDSRI